MDINKLKEKGIPSEIVSELINRGISILEPIQVEAIEKGLLDGENLLVAAPTSSGKTLIGELALIKKAIREKGCFYIVSHKALAEEKYKIFYDTYESKGWFDVAITTGDRTRFDQNLSNYGIIIATYEKFSSLLISNPDLIESIKLVVIDEIQILGDVNRGSVLEAMLIKLKENENVQLIGLSATIPQPKILADWLNCKLIVNDARVIDLQESIWSQNKIISKDFNSKEIKEMANPISKADTIETIKYLRENNFFPMIVFCMKKGDVEKLANMYYNHCSENLSYRDIVTSIGEVTEGTPTSRTLQKLLSRGIAIHTADLTKNERDIVEKSFADKKLPIIFATSTLSTGINLPAKTILIDSCVRDWTGEDIGVHEYVNMSGRAGRRGLQETGTSIIIAKNKAEEERFLKYLKHDLEKIKSQLNSERYGIQYHILHLIASNLCKNLKEILNFFDKSFLNYEFKIANAGNFDEVLRKIIDEQIDFLLKNNLIYKNHIGELEATKYGKIAVKKQLLPETILLLKSFLDNNFEELNKNFNEYILQMLYLTTLTKEFYDGKNTNNIFWCTKSERVPMSGISKKVNFLHLKEDVNNLKTALILNDFIEGFNYDEMDNKFLYFSHAKISSAAFISSWIIESLGELAELSEYGIDENVIYKFFILAQRVKFGVPENAVQIGRLFFEEQVKGVSRGIAIKLASNGIDSISKIIDMELEKLSKLVGPKNAQNIRDGVIRFVRDENKRRRMIHENRARVFSRDELISKLYTAQGRNFEIAVYDLLKSIDIKCELRDVGHADAEPDILVHENGNKIPVECKTTKDDSGTISSSEAFDVLGKGLNYNRFNLVTIGKPLFSETAISKEHKEVTLLLHSCLAELVIRVWEGSLKNKDVIDVFKRGGYIRIEQISPKI